MSKRAKMLIVLSPGFAKDEAETTCMPSQQLLIKSINVNYPSINITVLAFYYPGFEAEYKLFGSQIISFKGRNKEKLFRLITWIKVWRKLIRIKQQNNVIGLLSFWSTECAVIGNFFGKFYNIKHFTWLLGQDAKKDNKYVKFYKPAPHSLIAISDTLANEFYRNHHIKPVHIIYNGIDVNLFQAKAHERKIDVLGAGSLIPLKKYERFINIIHALKEDLPDINATICGGGPEEKNLLLQIKSLGLEKNIKLTGTLEHAETIALMQKTKVFLHTSIYEGFSTSCMEALYAGAHVVSFCYPLKEATKNWHVVKNEAEMIEKVREILMDKRTKYESVLIQTMDETAAQIMRLFN